MPLAKFGDRSHVEPGTIIMWAGAISNIPSGWVLCDGNNGTPDLTGRFIKGTNSTSESIGETGGQASYTITSSKMATHSHTGSTDASGGHTHTIDYDVYNDAIDRGGNQSVGNSYTDSSKAGSHSHSVSLDSTGSGDAVNNEPAYYELAFIQKT